MADVVCVRRILPDEFKKARAAWHKWCARVIGLPSDFPNDERRIVTAKTREEVHSLAIRFGNHAEAARRKCDEAVAKAMRASTLTPPERWHARERKLREKLRAIAYRHVQP